MFTDTGTTNKWLKSLPLVQEVRKWKRTDVIENLQKSVELDEDDIEILKKEKISGSDFLLLTKKDLKEFGLKSGPATRIAEFVKAINGDEKASDNIKILEFESLREQLKKSTYEFTVVVHPSRKKGLEWTANLENVTIDQFKEEDASLVCQQHSQVQGVLGNKLQSVQRNNLSDEYGHGNSSGHGPVNYAIDRFFKLLRKIGRTVGVTELKREDFRQGVAQNIVQMESSLVNRKRKDNEKEEELTGDKEKPMFKLFKPVIVDYKDADMKNKVKKVLSHIVWLLEEVEKAEMIEQGNKSIPEMSELSIENQDTVIETEFEVINDPNPLIRIVPKVSNPENKQLSPLELS
ncbi:3500_t:CDS:2, partial [Ambispora gerdemannii]